MANLIIGYWKFDHLWRHRGLNHLSSCHRIIDNVLDHSSVRGGLADGLTYGDVPMTNDDEMTK
jgi:hypothetical protein